MEKISCLCKFPSFSTWDFTTIPSRPFSEMHTYASNAISSVCQCPPRLQGKHPQSFHSRNAPGHFLVTKKDNCLHMQAW
jgi:hypothetical protein